MARHLVLKQNKRIRLKRKRIIIKATALLGVVFFTLAVLAWGAHSEHIRISNIYVEGNSVVSDKDIKKEVSGILTGKYFWAFPKNNIFLYSKQQIKKDILDIFKRIYSVKVNTVNMNSVKIMVKERSPFALWCGDSLYDSGRSISDKCYFLDKSGFIFTEAPNFSDSVYFEFYGIVGDSATGKQFLPREEFKRVILFRDLLNDADIKVNKFLIAENGDYTFYMDTLKGTAIFFNRSQNFEKSFYDLKSAIDIKVVESGKKDILEDLKYIDIRFDNKVLFKF